MPTMTFPAKFEFLDEIREMALHTAQQAGFTEKEIYAIQLSADEAASNIIEHAYEGVVDGVIQMTCDMQGDTLMITMRDYGKSFDPSKIIQPNLKVDLSERKIGGLGVYLMRKLMDEVRYESKAGESNLLIMLKRRG